MVAVMAVVVAIVRCNFREIRTSKVTRKPANVTKGWDPYFSLYGTASASSTERYQCVCFFYTTVSVCLLLLHNGITDAVL